MASKTLLGGLSLVLMVTALGCHDRRYEGQDEPKTRPLDMTYPGPNEKIAPPPNSNMQKGTGTESPSGVGEHTVTGAGK